MYICKSDMSRYRIYRSISESPLEFEITKVDCTYYAPNFEEVGGAYCFWDVCACVRPSVRPCVRPLHFLVHSITSEQCMLGF